MNTDGTVVAAGGTSFYRFARDGTPTLVTDIAGAGFLNGVTLFSPGTFLVADHAADMIWKVDLRTDLQCYSRLLHLIAHYELGNEEILDHLIKSVYRFMAKMRNLSIVEEEIFKFIRSSFHLSVRNIKPELEKLLLKLKALQNNRFETRAFSYRDIISWLESKIENIPVQEVLKKKFAGKRSSDNGRLQAVQNITT